MTQQRAFRGVLNVVLWLSVAGFVLPWVGAFYHSPDDFFAFFGRWLALTWLSALICLAGLHAGDR